MSDKPSAIITFGGGTGGNVSAMIRVEIDEAMHLDEEGRAISTFLPGEPVYLLVHHDSHARVVRVRDDTADGDLQLIGQVTRIKTEEITFTHAADEHDLQYQPSGQPSARWYGRQGSLSLSGRTLKASGVPCLGEISYPISATQYLYRPSSLISCLPGEQFPVDVVVEWEEVAA